MNDHFRWTQDRIGILVVGWKRGDAVVEIAALIGASRSSVIGKADRLGLGQHPNAGSAKAPGEDHSTPEAADAERAKAVRLPVVQFLLRRLPGEPLSVDARWI